MLSEVSMIKRLYDLGIIEFPVWLLIIVSAVIFALAMYVSLRDCLETHSLLYCLKRL